MAKSHPFYVTQKQKFSSKYLTMCNKRVTINMLAKKCNQIVILYDLCLSHKVHFVRQSFQRGFISIIHKQKCG